MHSFSYGYDCKRYFNLVCTEENVLVFLSGNLINFFNIETKEISFRRSFLGGGLGHLCVSLNIMCIFVFNLLISIDKSKS